MFELFLCPQEEDVQKFLNNTAIQFEKLNLTKTYLIFNNKNYIIAGYFALTLKAFQIKGELNNTLYKLIFGTSKPKTEEDVQRYFPTYLISQLGRNTSKFSNEELPGKLILEFAFSEIIKAQAITGGRTSMVECSNEANLMRFYEDNGFRQFLLDDKESNYIQLIKKVN